MESASRVMVGLGSVSEGALVGVGEVARLLKDVGWSGMLTM